MLCAHQTPRLHGNNSPRQSTCTCADGLGACASEHLRQGTRVTYKPAQAHCLTNHLWQREPQEHQSSLPPPVPQLSMWNCSFRPARSTTCLKTASALGLRHMLPAQRRGLARSGVTTNRCSSSQPQLAQAQRCRHRDRRRARWSYWQRPWR